MTDDFGEFDKDKLRKRVDDIFKRYYEEAKFLQWIAFLISQEESLKDSLEFDEYQTRDYFAREGVEMLPSEVRHLMDAVEGVFTALDFFRQHKNKDTNDDHND